MKNSTFDTLTAQTRAGAAAGVSPASLRPNPSDPVVPLYSGPKDQKRVVVILADGAQYPLVQSGDFVFVESVVSTAGLVTTAGVYQAVTVKPDTVQVASQIYVGGAKLRFDTSFNNLQFVNPTGNGSVTLTLRVGFGDYDPGITRTGPVQTEFYATVLATIAGAYATGDAVGGGVVSVLGVFLPGYPHARIVRARVSKNTTDTVNANVRLNIFNGDATLTPSVDNTAWPLNFSNIAYQMPPIDFPAFVTGAGGGNDMAYSDVSGISVPLVAGTTATAGVYLQLTANAAYVCVNPTTWRIDFTVEQY